MASERKAGDRHADGTQRNQSVLDFVAAHQAGNHAADADADGQRAFR